MPLPGPRSSYADNFGAITTAVKNAVGPASGPRDLVILADGLSGSSQECSSRAVTARSST